MKTNRIRFWFLLLSFCIASVCGGQLATAASVPVLVKDIETRIKDNSNISNLAAAGNVLIFTAYDRAHGNELWKSDGTAAGTGMVKDIRPGTGDSYHDPDYLTYWNGFVYFEAYGPNGWSLWKSDGTAGNTVEVSQDVDPEHFVIFNGALYFSGYGDGLWKTDGTTAGTVAVSSGIGTLDNLVVAGANRLYFTNGNDLWTSDGTTAGTILLQSDIYPTQLTSVNGSLYFQGWDNVNDYRLWTSNGTPAGTFVTSYGADPDNLIDVNGTLYFTATDPTLSLQCLLKLVGGVPTVVKSSISPTNLYNWNGTLYFAYSNGLWKSDGTPAGTVAVKASLWPTLMKGVGGTLFFNGWDSTHGYELWKSDGTPAGTSMVKDINPGTVNSGPSQLTNLNGTLFLTATDAATGNQLWKSDGTDAGTVQVQNLSPGSQDANPDKFLNVNGTLFFAAYDYNSGVKLWQTNGTNAATVKVPGFTGANPVPLVNAGGILYFTANADDLWKSDGTLAGTVLVKANVSITDPSKFSYSNGTLYFRGYDSAHGYELWKSDGTSTGTVMVKDIYVGTVHSYLDFLTNLNGTLYFVANSAAGTQQLWKSDGTDGGTVVVRSDIKNVSDLTLVNGKLIFSGDDATNTDALWVSDGTSGGTTMLVNKLYPSQFAVVGNTLFFQGWTTATGYELWKSDGTVSGTVLVKDIHAGTVSSSPLRLTNVNGTLYFTVWNTWDIPSHDQLWKSDGTLAGTVVVKDLPSTYGYTSIDLLTSVHGLLAFVFKDKQYPAYDDSSELWISDGTAAGTAMVKDIYQGEFGSDPATLTMANSPTNLLQNEALFFSAIDPVAGRELFILDFTPPNSAINQPLNGAYLHGTSFTITGTSTDSMPGSGVNLMEISTDNGTTWHNASDTALAGSVPWSSWTYTWSNPVDGVYTIKSRATDLATNVQTPLASIIVTVDNTLPVVTFSMPAVSHSLTVPFTFTETETNPDVYCLNTTNSPAGCSWSISKPSGSITLPSEGSSVYYAWARDKAGNVSAVKSATVLVALPHTLNIDLNLSGGGEGHVTFVQKSASYNVDTPVTVYTYDPITLKAVPSEYSQFNLWSGICSGSGDCIYSVPTVAVGGATHTATATFAFDSDHAVYVAPLHYYTTIGGAYLADTTLSGANIRIFGTAFIESLLFEKSKIVTLMGGDNQAHTNNSSGVTTVHGTMTIKSGTIIVENLKIR